MKKLLIVGGILIGISLVLGIILRMVLVPSAPPEGETNDGATSQAAPTSSVAPVPSPTPAPAASPVAAAPNPPPTPEAGRDAQYYFDEALSFLDAGRLKEAQANFRRVLEIDPQNSRAQTRLSLLDEQIEQKAERHFDSAREAFQFLRYEEAIAEWELFLTLAESSDVRYGEAQQGIQQAREKLR